MGMGTEHEKKGRNYKYVFCLADGENIVCNDKPHDKILWYARRLKIEKDSRVLVDLESAMHEPNDKPYFGDTIYGLTLQQIARAETVPPAPQLPQDDADEGVIIATPAGGDP